MIKLHKYVLICIGAWLLCVLSFPLAYSRVSNSGKYFDLPLKSLGWEDHQKISPNPEDKVKTVKH